jgi:acetyl esterase
MSDAIELNPTDLTLSDAEREHLALMLRDNEHFTALIGEREREGSDCLHPKAQWFLHTVARPYATPAAIDAEEANMLTPEGRAAARRFVDRGWGMKTRWFDGLARIEDRRIGSRGGPLPLRIYTPELRNPAERPPLLLYFHGGGWLFGSVAAVDRAMRVLAHESQSIVVSVDYRLAPEHPYPAAHDDAEDAWTWVLAQAEALGADPARLGVGGDSAGAHLAVAVARRCLAAGRRGPDAQLLYYPMVDWRRDTASFQRFGSGYGLDKRFIDMMERLVFPAPEMRASPEFSHLDAPTLAGLPRTLLITAGWDVLRDQGRAFAQRLAADGVPCLHWNAGSLGHGFMQRTLVYDDADRICIASAQAAGQLLRS